MTHFVLTRNFHEEGQLDGVSVLGVYGTPIKAMECATRLIAEIHEMMDWEDQPAKWSWCKHSRSWFTTDFPSDMGTYHEFVISVMQ